MKKNLFCVISIFLVICFTLLYSDKLFAGKSKQEALVNYNGNNLMISIDGEVSTTLPKDDNYYLVDYVCNNPNTIIKWNNKKFELNVTNGKNGGGVSCELTFESKPLLSKMPVGSYVSYVGTGGMIGNDSVVCKNNGELSSRVEIEETESSNSCSGMNAREDLENNDSGTYGYCYDDAYKYYVTGWRIAYVRNDKAMIVSAGSPECIDRISSDGNENYIRRSNSVALKYCNVDFVDGTCSCIDVDEDGLCDDASLDAWSINDIDFYYMTKEINGYGKRLTNYSSALGDSGGTITRNYCYSESDNKTSLKECGYNNDLLDNGGLYWFAAKAGLAGMSNQENGVVWWPNYRHVGISSYDYAYGIRPIISLSSSVYVAGGMGTLKDPYIIEN